MNLGAPELILLVALVAIPILVVVLLLRRSSGTDAARWAASESVALDPVTEPVVRTYLRTSRNLRQIGAVGGLVLAPSVTAATGIDLELPGILWLLTGYLIGCVWAELALTRRSTSDRRAATLTPRRLGDYVPAAMLRVQALAPAGTVALGIACAVLVDPATVDVSTMSWQTAASIDVVRRGAMLAAILGPLATAGTLVAQRTIVRRPQPFLDPTHVAVDDAMRSSSVRLLGATTIAIVGTLASVQLSCLTVLVHPDAAVGVGLAALALLLLALLQWRWWPHRGWQVRRPAPTVRTATLVAPASPGGDRG